MFYIITQVIIPHAKKTHNFVQNIILLYRSLPQNYFGEHSNEYNEQIQEICNNYGVEDEGFSKKKKKK
jgi:hypothetical protein